MAVAHCKYGRGPVNGRPLLRIRDGSIGAELSVQVPELDYPRYLLNPENLLAMVPELLVNTRVSHFLMDVGQRKQKPTLAIHTQLVILA